MKFSIKQNILMEHLNYVIKGVSSKNLIPILNCIKFELTDEGLYMLSTDNEIAIKTFINKDKIDNIDTKGEMVISGRYIYDIIRKLPNEIVNIEEVMDSKIFISTTNSSFNLNSNDASEFPPLDLEGNKTPINLSKRTFKTMINQTSFATSNQESRPILTGINFKIKDDKLECTATDSYRLAKKIIKLNEEAHENINITIPNKNLMELVKLFNDEDDNIELHIFNNKIIFKFNDIVFMSRLINGNFPDTNKLIPEEFLISITCNFNELYNSIDRASLLTTEAEKNTIKLESNNDCIVISSNIPEIGNVKETVYIKKNTNENITISFNAKYMLDALKSINGEDVELLFNSDIKPIIIKSPNVDNLIQLILPIRTY